MRLKLLVLLLLAAICTAGAVLRFVWLGQEGFWLDEMLSALMVIEGEQGLGRLFGRVFHTDVHPPLYYLLLYGWVQVFGDSEYAFRSLSAVIGAVTAPVALWALRRHLRPAGMVVLALCLVSLPVVLEASQQARAYPFLILVSLLSAAVLLDLVLAAEWDAASRRRLGRLTALLLFGCWLHYFTLVIALGAGIVLLWRWGREPAALRAIGLAGAAGLAGILVWLVPHALEEAHRLGPGGTYIDPVPREAVQALLAGLFGGNVGLGLAAFGAWVLIAILAPWREIGGDDRRRLAVLGGFLAAMLAIGLASALFAPSLSIRTVAALAPPVLIAVALIAQAGLERPRWSWRVAVAGLLAIALLPPAVASGRWLTTPHFPQWRESAAAILAIPGCRNTDFLTVGLWHPADYYRARFAPGADIAVTELYGRGVVRRLRHWRPDPDCPVIFWGDTTAEPAGRAIGAVLHHHPDLQFVHFRSIVLLVEPGTILPDTGAPDEG